MENKKIKISFDDDKRIINLTILPSRKTYTSKKYDVTIIQIFPNIDKLHHFFDLDNEDISEYNEFYKKINIYILHYPNGNECCVSYGNINSINGFEIEHKCSTESGSSGSPIIILDSFKVIGIHKGCPKEKDKKNINYGTLLKYPILEFNGKNCGNNEIIIKIKIEEQDINKDIYILNDPVFLDVDGKKLDDFIGLEELNNMNTLMFINEEECEYAKFKKFNEIGIYTIKLKFKILLTNAFAMFSGCKNIIDINFTSFITKNIKNMSHMFANCVNLTNLDLSSFDTRNTYDMKGMFFGCYNLKDINISSFDTKNVILMSEMF